MLSSQSVQFFGHGNKGMASARQQKNDNQIAKLPTIGRMSSDWKGFHDVQLKT